MYHDFYQVETCSMISAFNVLHDFLYAKYYLRNNFFFCSTIHKVKKPYTFYCILNLVTIWLNTMTMTLIKMHMASAILIYKLRFWGCFIWQALFLSNQFQAGCSQILLSKCCYNLYLKCNLIHGLILVNEKCCIVFCFVSWNTVQLLLPCLLRNTNLLHAYTHHYMPKCMCLYVTITIIVWIWLWVEQDHENVCFFLILKFFCHFLADDIHRNIHVHLEDWNAPDLAPEWTESDSTL